MGAIKGSVDNAISKILLLEELLRDPVELALKNVRFWGIRFSRVEVKILTFKQQVVGRM
jgi:hypothetical protein